MRRDVDDSSICPDCRQAIDPADINLQEGVAYCRACEKLFRLAHVMTASETRRLTQDFQGEPPAGTWLRNDGGCTIIGASMRSLSGALAALAFGLFWNSIVGVFVAFVLAATLLQVGFTLPAWFPAPNMNGSPMGVGMTIFMWLFLTPFMLVGAAFVGAFFAAIAGRVEIAIDQEQGRVFTGIGGLGFTRRFSIRSVKDVRLNEKQWTDSDGDRGNKSSIVIDAEKTITFASGLPRERRRFVAAKLSEALRVAA
jgi:hypothetical protein